METLLTLHVENQHAVTHFKRDTFTLYEYALIFGSSVAEAVKRVSKWAATYYTHRDSYYKRPSTSSFSSPHVNIPRPPSQVLSRNEEAKMRAWAKRHGKCVRQRNVRQDNTKDRSGTLPLNLYETETVLNPLDLKLLCSSQTEVQEDQEEADGHDSSENLQLENQQSEEYEQEDSYSDSESDSDDEVEDESVDSVTTTAMNLLEPTRLGRVRRLTKRMSDYLQM
ncbi:uncharacterized protein LOC110249856 [Exaiptasia diaphana]|uniref:Uncharacterized protein n=1 Tax=Exaiptasia diaphana TaxID=2652724 RepID=A0A913Y0D3_EXADI|nr:uncharacterized protein LOC110249856 [Exaiptasia diaphana]